MDKMKEIKIIDLTEENEESYFLCLCEHSEELKEAGSHKRDWFKMMREKGFKVKLATDENNTIGGMIQYGPIEHSMVQGDSLYFIYCIWVHGYKQGRGNFQKRGMGKALLSAAEKDVKEIGAKGIAAWGVSLPFWMKASWFKKRGYQKVDKNGMAVLLWKPFSQDAVPPKWIRQKQKPEVIPDKVIVTGFLNGWCPAQNMIFERARKASLNFGDKVVFHEVRTSDRETMLEWGISDALFIDGKEISTGPPPSYKKIWKLIHKRIKKLNG
jgi:GNAT superfamily N-acetyltransferase